MNQQPHDHGDRLQSTQEPVDLIKAVVDGIQLQFQTEPKLFSPMSLDRGTLAMLACARFEPGDKVLDLGCGYGLVGVFAAKRIGPDNVYLLDNNPEAIRVATCNLVLNGVSGAKLVQSDGFRNLDAIGFTKILCNPPYHADFAVPKHFIEKGFNRLALGGTLWMVTKREAWYRNKLIAVFGGVRTHNLDGYFVFEAIKKSSHYAQGNKKTKLKIEDLR
jgi:16S rRNA (guanine1207-N2)-methyltransferase